jgi:imidazolonepropionase-like amidohydrolase
MFKFPRLTLGETLQMLTINPARLLSIENKVGSIDVGKWANLVFLSN